MLVYETCRPKYKIKHAKYIHTTPLPLRYREFYPSPSSWSSRTNDKCIVLCDSAITTDPKAWKAFSRRGRAHIGLGDYKSARADLREAAAIAPTDADRRAVQQELRKLQVCKSVRYSSSE